ncbi:MAG TPA: ABC transporter permease [Candidatus Saccharimonadales bacterium]|nr:ABC transporter permease [Candidatus Saccharimonadales bacterium]
MRTFSLFQTLGADVRFATRSLLKNPGFLVVVVLSLALGIAANSTIFSVLNTFLYRPLPYPHPEKLAVIWETESAHPDRTIPPPIAELVDWQKQNHVFEDIAMISFNDTASVSGLGEPRPLRVEYVTPNLFSLLGAKPILGRVFLPAEAQDHAQTVLISDEFWKRELNADPQVLGKTFAIEGVVSTIVGVMQPHFAPFYGGRLDVWIPINAASSRYSARIDHWLTPVARLKSGVSLAQAQTEMDVVAHRLEQAYPATNKGVGTKVRPLHEDLYRFAGPILYPLFGAVAFVLLIACVNVANLLQFRTETRRKEYALRASLGAGRRRLIQQLLTESSILALSGGLLGIALTFGGIKLLIALAGEIPNANEINVDARVLLFTLGVSLLTAVLFGLAPAIQASRPDLNVVLRESERKTTTSSGRMARHSLAVAEVALAMVLLVGAGLMINTIFHLQRVNPGFDVSHVLSMDLQLPEGGKYVERVPGGDMEKTQPTVTAFYQRLLEKTSALPGVDSAALIGALPTRCCPEFYSFAVLGHPAPSPENRPRAGYSEVSAGIFSTLRIPLIKGRYPDEHDTGAAPWAIVINQSLARKFFPNEDPIGRQFLLRYDPYPVDEIRPRQIVGIVGDVKHFGLGEETPPFVYAPFAQQPAVFPGGAARAHLHKALVLRTSSGRAIAGTNLAVSVKAALAEIDPNQPVTNIMTMEDVLTASMGDYRFYMELLGIFAGVAVLLAAVGIYGVMSYSVSERTHEIGIRVALGARPGDVLGLVAKLGLKLTSLGVVIGVALAFGVTRLISTFLFGVKPTDPLTYAAVALSLAAIALLACYIPARRAIKVDPLVALRYE